MSLYTKCLPPILSLPVMLMFWAVSNDVLAQRAISTNKYACNGYLASDGELGEMAIGVCDLDRTHELLYQDTSIQGAVGFSIRSCWSWWAVEDCGTQSGGSYGRYTVEVNGPTDSNHLVLTGSNGDFLPIALAFSHPAAGSESLSPGVESNTRFPGAPDMQQTPVEFGVSLPTSTPATSGSYSGTFDFHLYQCTWWSGNPQCKDAAGQSGAPALLNPPIPFTITLTVPTKIRISGLNDMQLDANPTGDTEGDQGFCVHTSGGVPFNILAESENGAGNFSLAGSAGIDSVNYQLQVQGIGQPPKPRRLTEGMATTNGRWSGHPQNDCNGGDNMRLTVRIPASELSDPEDNHYTDTLTLTVTPE
ncbi:hypothetical protein ACFSKX_06190 [Microbulbifer halophilus]|uniref:Spore coat protein U domain-containing protein n=2 Tax=Microbulbifer halophilus TaxID=453963 RepID=A0ABW5EF32_9GAMM